MAVSKRDRAALKAARAEIDEAFRPVRTWRFYAPAERIHDNAMFQYVQTALLDLAYWGWSVEIIRNGKGWTVRLRRRYPGGMVLTASATSDTYLDAIHELSIRLGKVIDRLISPNELKTAA